MKSMNFTTPEKTAADNAAQEKQFQGKPLNAIVFEKKFKKANEVGCSL